MKKKCRIKIDSNMNKMTSKKYFFPVLFVFVLISFLGCNPRGKINESEPRILITTTMGDIKIKLYNDTPQHRDNFLKLVDEGFYTNVLFHRVISNFMIQSGDPESREAEKDAALGNGGPGYQIPAEFAPHLYHKKGALAAARMGDQYNPEKKSSGSQFYIVQGQSFTDDEIDQVEQRINNMLKQGTFFKFVDEERRKAEESGDSIDMSRIQEVASLRTEEVFSNSEPYTVPAEQREVYKTLGGTPHLDQNYTVFGEVVEGLDVVDAIASVATNDRDRPREDVRILKMKKVKK